MMAPPPEAGRPPAAPPRARWILGTVGGVVLGAVLGFAAYAKVIDPEAFVELVRQEGLTGPLPPRLVAFVALALEVGLGLLLLVGVRRRSNIVATTLLVLFFVFLTGRTYVLFLQGKLDPAHGCGCFGTLIERTPKQAFWQDILLLLPPLALVWIGLERGVRETPWRRVLGVASCTAGALVFAHFAPDLPLDDLATRLHVGSDAREICAGEGKGRICLSDVVPRLSDGRHLVLLADLEDPAFLAKVPDYNAYALDGKGPTLWVLTTSSHEVVQRFSLLSGASFQVQEAPPALVRPLYRRLPRSFLVVDGIVKQTYGEPPWGSMVTSDGR